MRAYAFLWVMTLLFFLSGGAADQIATSVANLSSDDTWLKFLVSLLLFCICWMATMLSLWINPHMDVGQVGEFCDSKKSTCFTNCLSF